MEIGYSKLIKVRHLHIKRKMCITNINTQPNILMIKTAVNTSFFYFCLYLHFLSSFSVLESQWNPCMQYSNHK